MSSNKKNTNGVIGSDSRVSLYFSLSLEDGSIIDSNFEKTPAELSMGDGNLPPGFEEHLLGMNVAQKGSFTVLPEKAFGQHNPSNIQQIKRSSFAADMTLSQGLVVSFADANRGELPGVIQTIGDDEVTVDFNHPLAGKALTFKVEIVAVDNSVTEVM
jgi:FKBP-type peptidyl-prolyl cis-trans isomerase SlpA